MRYDFFCLTVAALALARSTEAAQQGVTDATTAIMTTAAIHVRSQVATGPLAIDVDPATGNAATRAASVAGALNAAVAKPTHACSGTTPDTCHLVGFKVALRIMPPVVRGDTAQVLVHVWEETTNKRQPIHRSELLVNVVRRGNAWIATGSKMNSES